MTTDLSRTDGDVNVSVTEKGLPAAYEPTLSIPQTWRQWWKPLVVLVGARLELAFVATLARPLIHDNGNPFLIVVWDGGWFLRAAREGWPQLLPMAHGEALQSTLGFFPAFPILIRAMHAVFPVSWVAAGAAAAGVSQVVMVIAVWQLAAEVWGIEAADRAIVLMCFMPGAFVLDFVYSEPLLASLAALSFLALRRKWWLGAGVAASLAGAVNPLGLVVTLAVGWEAVTEGLRRGRWRGLIGLGLAPLGALSWYLYVWATTGNRNSLLLTQSQGWGQTWSLVSFWQFIYHLRNVFWQTPNVSVLAISTATGVALFLLAVLIRTPPFLLLYCGALLMLLYLSSHPVGVRPRFFFLMFPLVLALGSKLKGVAFGVAVGVGAATAAILMVVSAGSLAFTP